MQAMDSIFVQTNADEDVEGASHAQANSVESLPASPDGAHAVRPTRAAKSRMARKRVSRPHLARGASISSDAML